MARRRGKPGDYLFTDYYSGATIYASQAKKDYWNNYTKNPLERNLQEIAVGLDDPFPVQPYSGPQYEVSVPCDYEIIPLFIGNTNVRTPNSAPAVQALNLDPGIGLMAVGCNFEVR